MEQYEENRKIFSKNGIINRRNFIANILIINAATTLIFIMPLIFLFMIKPDYMFSLIGIEEINPIFAIFIILWLIAFTLCKTVLYFPNILKRIKDILGENKEKFAYPATIFIVTYIFIAEFISSESLNIFKWILLVIFISLMSIKGAISSKEPKNELAKFNWGAFLGTWIWGLFNKSYKTLWALPLWFTPAGLQYAIVCGLKGNTWANKNNPAENIEDFQKKQKKQTKIWLCITPILIVIIFFSSLLISQIFVKNYNKAHPEFKIYLEKFLTQQDIAQAQRVFSQIEFKNGEYKFYIDPVIWNKTSDFVKEKIVNTAAVYVTRKDNELVKLSNNEEIPVAVLKKVKVYSSFNNEILGEFDLKPEDKFTKLQIRYIKDKYKINKYPSLP